MTLIVAGYWQTTYWADYYWTEDYWPEYGVAAPPAAPPAAGTFGAPVPRPDFPIYLMKLIRDYVKSM